MQILTFADYFLPGYKAGGAIRAIANLTDALCDHFDFHIVTRDRDYGDPKAFSIATPGQWQDLGNSRVYYLQPKEHPRAAIQKVDYDLIYLNSFFSPRMTLQTLMLRKLRLIKRTPVLLAPHGELYPGAMRFKALKKTLFLRAAKMARFYDGVTLHATSEQEIGHIREVWGDRLPIRYSPNLFRMPLAEEPSIPKQAGTLEVVHMSRICKSKNLVGAVEALLGPLKAEHIHFRLIGPKEDPEYWAKAQALIRTFPEHISFEDLGELPPHRAMQELKSAHAFLFPTHTENYGFVILEAMGTACVPIISDRTPWQDLDAKHAGFVCPFGDTAAFTTRLQQIIDMDQESFDHHKHSAYQYANAVANDTQQIERTASIFRALPK